MINCDKEKKCVVQDGELCDDKNNLPQKYIEIFVEKNLVC